MPDPEELRSALRAVVRAGGDVVAVALAIGERTEPGYATRIALVLRDEFGLSIPEALAVASWAEGTARGDEARADLRSRVTTPLRLNPSGP
jgi:hypothetical protein